jgi:NAD(P)-dependent dehydrogenase (short-subunit alcohol dehydrogenase family)
MGSSLSSSSASDGTPQSAWEAVQGKDLTGQVFVVTGAYAGLGAATTKALLSVKATVIVAGRNPKAQEDFVQALEKEYDPSLIDGSQTMDLGDLSSVRDFSKYVDQKYAKIQCLICNAGVMNTPRGVTKDGFETQMGTNVIGHFLLAKLLAKKTARQVWLSSAGHLIQLGTAPPGGWDTNKAPRINLEIIQNIDDGPYDGWHRYQQSKLGDILLAKQFAKEFPNMKACSVHPGVVQTNLGKHLSFMDIWRFVYNAIVNYSKAEKPVPPEVGARTQVMCATMDNIENGAYYAFGKKETLLLAESAKNTEDAKKLYDYCDEVTRGFQK